MKKTPAVTYDSYLDEIKNYYDGTYYQDLVEDVITLQKEIITSTSPQILVNSNSGTSDLELISQRIKYHNGKALILTTNSETKELTKNKFSKELSNVTVEILRDYIKNLFFDYVNDSSVKYEELDENKLEDRLIKEIYSVKMFNHLTSMYWKDVINTEKYLLDNKLINHDFSSNNNEKVLELKNTNEILKYSLSQVTDLLTEYPKKYEKEINKFYDLSKEFINNENILSELMTYDDRGTKLNTLTKYKEFLKDVKTLEEYKISFLDVTDLYVLSKQIKNVFDTETNLRRNIKICEEKIKELTAEDEKRKAKLYNLFMEKEQANYDLNHPHSLKDALESLNDKHTFSLEIKKDYEEHMNCCEVISRLEKRIENYKNDLVWLYTFDNKVCSKEEIKYLLGIIDEYKTFNELVSKWYEHKMYKKLLIEAIDKVELIIDLKRWFDEEFVKRYLNTNYLINGAIPLKVNNIEVNYVYDFYYMLFMHLACECNNFKCEKYDGIYITDYQEHSIHKINLIHSIHTSNISLFGNCNHNINRNGIKKIEHIFEDYSIYEFNANYLSTKEIVEYYNEELGLRDTAIGVSGDSVKKIAFIDIISEEDCVIICNEKHFGEILERVEMQDDKNIAVLNVIDTIGKHFDSVIVYDEDMTDTEKSIAYTRALKSLKVIGYTKIASVSEEFLEDYDEEVVNEALGIKTPEEETPKLTFAQRVGQYVGAHKKLVMAVIILLLVIPIVSIISYYAYTNTRVEKADELFREGKYVDGLNEIDGIYTKDANRLRSLINVYNSLNTNNYDRARYLYEEKFGQSYISNYDTNGGILTSEKIKGYYTYYKSKSKNESIPFVGYNIKSYEFSDDGMLAIELIAEYKVYPYKINYELGGGINNIKNPIGHGGEENIIIYSPYKDGFVFKGWSYEKGGDIIHPLVIDKTTRSEVTLYANWVSRNSGKYYLSFDSYYGNQVLSGYYGSENYDLPTPIKEGRTFDGWYIEPELIHKATLHVLIDGMVLYAKWKEDSIVKVNHMVPTSTEEQYYCYDTEYFSYKTYSIINVKVKNYDYYTADSKTIYVEKGLNTINIYYRNK